MNADEVDSTNVLEADSDVAQSSIHLNVNEADVEFTSMEAESTSNNDCCDDETEIIKENEKNFTKRRVDAPYFMENYTAT